MVPRNSVLSKLCFFLNAFKKSFVRFFNFFFKAIRYWSINHRHLETSHKNGLHLHLSQKYPKVTKYIRDIFNEISKIQNNDFVEWILCYFPKVCPIYPKRDTFFKLKRSYVLSYFVFYLENLFQDLSLEFHSFLIFCLAFLPTTQ